jgi:ABC-type transport system involved in multi-copper enzyme maturation permease subunit
MTTNSTGTRPTFASTRAAPFFASTRAELLRLRTWPAVWVTLGAWLTLAAMFGYLFNYIAYATGSQNFATDGQPADSLLAQVLPGNVPDVLVQGTPMFGGALMMVLGALVAGSGYGWGTWKTVFTQGPSRTAALLGSMAAVAVVVLGLVVASTAMGFGLSLGIAGLEAQPVTWPSLGALAGGMGAAYLILLMWALVGFGLGTLARGPALSVGLGLVWALVLENLLRGVGALLSPVEAFTHITPGTAAGSLVGAIVGVPAGGQTDPGVLDTLSRGQSLATVAAYVVLVPVATLVLVRRRDVT